MSKQYKLISRNMDTVGDGTGTTNAVGDYSSTAASFKIAPGDNERFVINRIIVSIEDSGTVDSGAYGNAITLTNGIDVSVATSAGALYTMTPNPIKTNSQWAKQCHDLTIHDFGSGNSVVTARWTFGNSGTPLVLDGDAGQYLEVALSDNFSGLITHYFLVQGYDLNKKV